MKKYINLLLLFSISFGSSISAYADEECAQSLSEAKGYYNHGQYEKAKEYFEYVQKICGENYGSADTWIQKCNQALSGSNKPSSSQQRQSSSSHETTLSASKMQINVSSNSTTEYITISSNKSWSISQFPEKWCDVIKYDEGIAISISESPFTSFDRTTSLIIMTDDGQKNLKIDIKQYRRSQSSSSSTSQSSSATATTLSLSKTSIYASASGTTEYITVTSNRDWEIQFASTLMYTVTKLSNTSIKVVINKNTGVSRGDFFNIKTTDGSKTVKVTMSQGQGSNSSSSSSYRSSNYRNSSYRKNSSYRSSNSGYTALKTFNSDNGVLEVDWLSFIAGVGTGLDMGVNAFAIRYSFFKIDPLVFGWDYDFLSEKGGWYYQPEIKFLFPWNGSAAFEIGIGPSVRVRPQNESYQDSYFVRPVWLVAEIGVYHHCGQICTFDYFLRYDGSFLAGIAFNIGTGFFTSN